MVDKKLSEFSQITPAEIAKLICLFLDENSAIKNGVVDFATLDALLMHKEGDETITGDKTFSGDAVFSGNATFNNDINGIIERAKKDVGGNNIVDTYATKNELSSVMKTGFVVPYGGSTSPSGWLICDGSAISRTTYSDLFNVIGTTYGAGDGSTTFNIPNISSIVKSVDTNVSIKGNGMALGFDTGVVGYEHMGLRIGDGYQSSALVAMTGNYGATVGAVSSGSGIATGRVGGITTDPTKSGVIGTVTRSVVNFKFIIKY